MTIYKKPDLKVFGANAKPTEIAEFEDLLRGWGITIEKTNGIPPMEWFNYLFNRLDGNINYILQNGITEYDTNLEYPQNAVVKSDGKLYLCLRQNTNKPLSNGAYWELLIKNATTSQGGIVQLSSSVTSTDETKASTPKATKTAYDKATQADNNANNRVSKSGDIMTGGLKIRAGDYSKLILENSGKSGLMLENAPESAGYFGMLAERITNATRATIRLPRKSGEVVLDTSFKQSNQKNGWCKLPNGLILQWRECTQTEKVQTFWYPISFNTACYFVALTDNSIGTIPKLAETGLRTKTTVTIRHADGDVTAGQFFMFAIGF